MSTVTISRKQGAVFDPLLLRGMEMFLFFHFSFYILVYCIRKQILHILALHSCVVESM